ncbi:MAG: 3-dehydroquinate synthase [Clostridia bacterium]|nr:3-dehydroquinate synthase [Clostridia bacterium]
MKVVDVNTGRPYKVLIGSGILGEVGSLVKEVLSAKRLLIITDDIVNPLYGGIVAESLAKVGYEVEFFVIENGEQSKCLSVYGAILNYLADGNYTRKDGIVALGGGVVGDLAGFVAASYLRGIPFVQIPTTLLAQIDSSVGGKTAIDLEAGKNLVGAFWQPSLVVADVNTLSTLPHKEIENGLGELIKYACLMGGEILTLVERGFESSLERVVELAVSYKRDIVTEDERESGVRRLLNLGHTVAHGIEKLSHYTYTHGKAVACGIMAIAKAENKLGNLSDADYDRLKALYDFYGLEYAIGYSIESICEVAKVDKKAENTDINLVIMQGYGDCKVQKMALADLEGYLL